jgi:uncharacterized damage-inducible protein DinB
MFTASDLLELHTRYHATLAKLLRHCRKLSADELQRELPGFGYPTVQQQLHHIVDAEAWWVGILEGRYEYVDSVAQYPTVKAIEAYRKQVAAGTAAYLARVKHKELNTPREMQVWKRRRRTLVPAQVFMRPFTHGFHHIGQVAAMCRLLGQPIPPTNYPIE